MGEAREPEGEARIPRLTLSGRTSMRNARPDCVEASVSKAPCSFLKCGALEPLYENRPPGCQEGNATRWEKRGNGGHFRQDRLGFCRSGSRTWTAAFRVDSSCAVPDAWGRAATIPAFLPFTCGTRPIRSGQHRAILPQAVCWIAAPNVAVSRRMRESVPHMTLASRSCQNAR